MKNTIKAFYVILNLMCMLLLWGCGKTTPEQCEKHIGVAECSRCGLNYFDELSMMIKKKATLCGDGRYEINAVLDSVDFTMQYDPLENQVLAFLIYKNADQSPAAIFLMTMKPNTGTTYGWTLTTDNKYVGGTFKAEEVKALVFRPEIQTNDFTEDEMVELNSVYEESISFCVDMIYSILKSDNPNNLSIADLGFSNYSPNVQ